VLDSRGSDLERDFPYGVVHLEPGPLGDIAQTSTLGIRSRRELGRALAA
jgi:hypothetical protein